MRRYQWEKPGQMLPLDIKRLGKIDGLGQRKAGTRQVCRRRPGWEYLHVCIDDASRVAYTEIHPDETAESAVELLWHAVAWYTARGMKIKRVLTDNGACYKPRKFREACREFGIRHKKTWPYRPRTNGKAERFIQTAFERVGIGANVHPLMEKDSLFVEMDGSLQFRASPFGFWQKTSSLMSDGG